MRIRTAPDFRRDPEVQREWVKPERFRGPTRVLPVDRGYWIGISSEADVGRRYGDRRDVRRANSSILKVGPGGFDMVLLRFKKASGTWAQLRKCITRETGWQT